MPGRKKSSRPSNKKGGNRSRTSRSREGGYPRDREGGERSRSPRTGGRERSYSDEREGGERRGSFGRRDRPTKYSRDGARPPRRESGYSGDREERPRRSSGYSGNREGSYGGRSREGGSRSQSPRSREGGYSGEGGSRGKSREKDFDRSETGREGGYGTKRGRDRTFNRDRSKKYSSRDRNDDYSSGPAKFGAGFDRSKFIKKAKEQTTEVLRSRDMYLAYLSNCIDEEERVANQLVERLEELYGLYFPELQVDDRRNFALIIAKIKREDVDVEAISKYVGEGKARQIARDGEKSIGGDFTEKDVLNMQKMAEEIETMYALMNRHEKYLDDVCEEVCPNLRYLVGAKIAGKLIAAAGGLKKLAVMPASTVQMLGAEKALFKHLKNKSIAPPKHGLIFQHASISTSPKGVRGKIARALATKIALVVKADEYTKRFIAPEIKEKFEKRFADIMAKDKAAARRR